MAAKVRALVTTHHHKQGVDVVRVMITARFMPWLRALEQPGQPDEPRADDGAHRFGDRIAGHRHGVVGIESALQSGLDSREHCWFIADGLPHWSHDVLRSATSRSANARCIITETGHLTTGFTADVLAIDGDPGVSASR